MSLKMNDLIDDLIDATEFYVHEDVVRYMAQLQHAGASYEQLKALVDAVWAGENRDWEPAPYRANDASSKGKWQRRELGEGYTSALAAVTAAVTPAPKPDPIIVSIQKYRTTVRGCECPDRWYRRRECKHMRYLRAAG